MTRLATHVWVGAYLTRLRLIDIPAFVVSKGDADAGTVLIKMNTLNGSASLHHRSFDLITGNRKWDVLATGPEIDIDASITRQRHMDPDLWVLEVEDRQGRHLLEDPSLG